MTWYYVSTMAEGPKGANVTDNKDEVKNGDSWTNVRFFSSFEEADEMRKSLKIQDRMGMKEIKVKRCGEGGSMFVVKMRESAEAKAQLDAIEEKMLTKKNKKMKK